MTTYRDFIIEEQFVYCDPFTKVPNGLFDGMYYHKDEETGHMIYRQTMEEVKREIDEIIYENTKIEVQHSRTLAPVHFDFYNEAYQFCKMWNLSLDCIKFFFKGQEVSFNAP